MLLTVLAGIGAALALYWLLNKIAELPARQVGGPDQAATSTSCRPTPRSSLYLIYPADRRRSSTASRTPPATTWVGFDNYTDLLTSHGVPADAVQHVALDHHRAGGHRGPRPRRGDARRPAQARRREARQDDHLPADGDQHRRCRHRLAVRLRATARRARRRSACRTRSSTKLGLDPVAWLQQSQFHLNSLLLMVMLLWAQVGFSMVLLSAAIKGVPGRHPRGGPDRRRQRAADLLPGRRPADQGHDHHGVHHRR